MEAHPSAAAGVPDPEELLTANQVCRLLKISRRTFYRMRAAGQLPPPVLQPNRTLLRWRRGDLRGEVVSMQIKDMATPRSTPIEAIVQHVKAAKATAETAAAHAAVAIAQLLKMQRDNLVNTKETSHAEAQAPATA